MGHYKIDPRLEADSFGIGRLGLCEMRLMRDSRWPWIILVPQRPDITEFHDLSPLDQTMLTFETTLASEALKKVTGCEKINIGALGNVVAQFHMHVVARSSGDDNWPRPVWGHGTPVPWTDEAQTAFVDKLLGAF